MALWKYRVLSYTGLLFIFAVKIFEALLLQGVQIFLVLVRFNVDLSQVFVELSG